MSSSCCWLVDPKITPEEWAKKLETRTHYMSAKSGLKQARYMLTLCGYDTMHKFPITGERIRLNYRVQGASCEKCTEIDLIDPEDTVKG
jgi:hypothetical protein